MDPDKVIKAIEFAKKLIKLLSDALTEEGTVIVFNRNINYVTKPKLRFENGIPVLRYYCKLVDVASSINARADNYKGKKGALEHAVENLTSKLKTIKILN